MSAAGPTARVRWGVVGTGRMAAVFARELAALSANEGHDAAAAAVASRSFERASAFAETYGVARAYFSVTELAASADVDAVYIASPPSEHAAHARACLEAGKAVLCEKPFTTNAREASELIELARRRKAFLMEAMWTRFLPSVAALREVLRERTIGDVQLIVAGGGFIPDCAPGYYLLDRNLGGGVLLDAGVYLVSLACMILGAPDRVLASAEIGPHGVDEHDVLVLDHAGGAKAVLYVSLRTRRMPDMEILGTGGRIVLHGPVFDPSGYTIHLADGTSSRQEVPRQGTGYGYQVAEVMNCLRRGELESTQMPLAETLAVLRVMDEARHQFGLRYAADTDMPAAEPATGAMVHGRGGNVPKSAAE